MLYLIGGVSRSGKSMVAEMILLRKKIPYLPLDSIVMGFTNGIPEYGVNDKQFPDEIAKRLWKFTKAMIENLLFVGNDYTVEGEAFLPAHVSELTARYPGKIKSCFLGYPETSTERKFEEVKKHNVAENDWLLHETEDSIIGHIRNMIGYSKFVREECKTFQMPFFDTSLHFKKGVRDAANYLIRR